MQRIGVFVCHCGTNIAATVDVEAVAKALGINRSRALFSLPIIPICALRAVRI